MSGWYIFALVAAILGDLPFGAVVARRITGVDNKAVKICDRWWSLVWQLCAIVALFLGAKIL